MTPSTLSWPLVVVIACVLGGASFLGHDHVLTGDFVGSIYAAVISGGLVGHFTTQNNSNG